MTSSGEHSSHPKPLRLCPFIRSLKDTRIDNNHDTSLAINVEPPLKSSFQSHTSSSQAAKPALETLSDDKLAPITSVTPIITQDKCPLCGCAGTTTNTQTDTVYSRKVTAKHTQPQEISVVIDLICQLVDFTVVRMDIVFVQDLSSTLSVPDSIQSAISSCSSAKKIQLSSTDSVILSSEVSYPLIMYTISSSDYLQYIRDIGKKTKNFAAERLNGIIIRPNICIPLALLNWSLPNTIVSNKIKREEKHSYQLNIDPLTPNLHTMRPWHREAIEFYLLRGGKCILADPQEMDIAAQALLSVYQHRNSFPLFIIAHTNSIPYWKENVYLWYNDELTRNDCMTRWLEEKAAHEAKTVSLQKSAIKRSSGSEPRMIKRSRLRYVYELPSEYSINPNGNYAVYALGYEDITSRGAFSQIYAHAVQTCFEGVSICKERMIVVLTVHNFLTLYNNGLVHPHLSTVILSDAQEYKDMSAKRTKELSSALTACPHIVMCTSVDNVGFVKTMHPQLSILGLSIGKMDFLTRYCEMKKRELNGGKVIMTASGISMHDELAYIFNTCCLSRRSEKYIGTRRRFTLCLENSKDKHTEDNGDSSTIIDLQDSGIALDHILDALVGFYAISSMSFMLIVHEKNVANMLVDALNNKGVKAESISGKTPINTSIDCISRFQNSEIDTLVCVDDAISIHFTLKCTCVCFFVGLLWSSSEIRMWEGKLQMTLTLNKQCYSVFIYCNGNKTAYSSDNTFSRRAKLNPFRCLELSNFSARENFITNLLHSLKVPKWDSYFQVSLNTVMSKHINAWLSN